MPLGMIKLGSCTENLCPQQQCDEEAVVTFFTFIYLFVFLFFYFLFFLLSLLLKGNGWKERKGRCGGDGDDAFVIVSVH